MFNLLVDLNQAFAIVETWIAAGIAFLSTTSLGGIIVSILMRVFTKKVNAQTTVSQAQIEKTAQLSAKTAVKSVVGKSFNVNIKAEVDKAVQAEMKPIRENAEFAATAAKNAEIASAHVLLAQSRSRLLSEEEQVALQSIAKKIITHADSVTYPQTTVAFEDATVEVLKEETMDGPDNASLVSFDDIA